MPLSDALWNEVARIINVEFVDAGESLTGVTLAQLILFVNEMLTEEDPSA